MKILGIETSCDETAAAIVTSDKQILSHIIFSQLEEHRPYGGVVPEIASRAHLDRLDKIIVQVMDEANIKFSDLDAIAVTAGPGLIGGVIVGVMMAKAIASASKKPFIAVNHLEAHALTARLTNDIEFPFLLLLVSGGHCQILTVEAVSKYQLLGSTIDDALGEAFDKVAKMLGIAYPGGPKVEKLARGGNPKRFNFPRSMKGKAGCDFSFSGLKTAVKREIDKIDNKSQQDIADICASFQACVTDILEDRLQNAINIFINQFPLAKSIVIAGGVAANQHIKSALEIVATKNNMHLIAPPINLCTDNAAMIAWAGLERFSAGLTDDLSFEPRARWPLSELCL
jgi:N6-L-threonylcarbamoyladenine synthase